MDGSKPERGSLRASPWAAPPGGSFFCPARFLGRSYSPGIFGHSGIWPGAASAVLRNPRGCVSGLAGEHGSQIGRSEAIEDKMDPVDLGRIYHRMRLAGIEIAERASG